MSLGTHGVSRRTTAATLLVAAALSVVLFSVKYRVQALEHELNQVHRAIVAEKRAIHVLGAEWSYLNDPERLRRLATTHLGLGPISPDQLVTLETKGTAAGAVAAVKAARATVTKPGGRR
jgi:cell division protein FtsL